jgi:hypothetical protein
MHRHYALVLYQGVVRTFRWRPNEATQLKRHARVRTSVSAGKISPIEAKAGRKYGSKGAGKRVAGAILAKQRAKGK